MQSKLLLISFYHQMIFTFNNLFLKNILTEVIKSSDFFENYDISGEKEELIT